MPVSEDVLRLVRTVERLPSEDQDKILRMVDLLTLVPLPVQHRTQRMLRELLERQPDTKSECVAGVDDVLAYLERNATMAGQARKPRGAHRVRADRARSARAERALLDRDLHGARPRRRRILAHRSAQRGVVGARAHRRGSAPRERQSPRARHAKRRAETQPVRLRTPRDLRRRERILCRRSARARAREAACRATETCRRRAPASPRPPTSPPRSARVSRASDSSPELATRCSRCRRPRDTRSAARRRYCRATARRTRAPLWSATASRRARG